MAVLKSVNAEKVGTWLTLAHKMKRKRIGCLVAVLLAVSGVVTWDIRAIHAMQRAAAKFDDCDHVALLAACRQMIATRTSFTNSPNYNPPSYAPDDICLTLDAGPYGPEVPAILRELSPQYIGIREDHVVISDPSRSPPMRRGVLAFAESAEFQYGTRQYIDGLWYWNGKLHSSVKPEYDRRMDEKRKRIEGQQPLSP